MLFFNKILHVFAIYFRAVTFDGGVVGKALKGPICTYEYSGGVNMVCFVYFLFPHKYIQNNITIKFIKKKKKYCSNFLKINQSLYSLGA